VKKTRAFEVFAACANAIMQGVLINRVRRTDKEFHKNHPESFCRKRALLRCLPGYLGFRQTCCVDSRLSVGGFEG
jgi:hypothetical protein